VGPGRVGNAALRLDGVEVGGGSDRCEAHRTGITKPTTFSPEPSGSTAPVSITCPIAGKIPTSKARSCEPAKADTQAQGHRGAGEDGHVQNQLGPSSAPSLGIRALARPTSPA
jgi:hypothetical protein